ncbi:hypothetical protein AAMO2058_001565700 [Amorphochlora amoebiformis]
MSLSKALKSLRGQIYDDGKRQIGVVYRKPAWWARWQTKLYLVLSEGFLEYGQTIPETPAYKRAMRACLIKHVDLKGAMCSEMHEGEGKRQKHFGFRVQDSKSEQHEFWTKQKAHAEEWVKRIQIQISAAKNAATTLDEAEANPRISAAADLDARSSRLVSESITTSGSSLRDANSTGPQILNPGDSGWNSKFQKVVESKGAASMEQIGEFEVEFIQDVSLVAMKIVDELIFPPSRRNLCHERNGRDAMGQFVEVLNNGVEYKVYLTQKDFFSKALTREIQGLSAYVSASEGSIRIIPICEIIYKGFRIMARAPLPSEDLEFVYGRNASGGFEVDKIGGKRIKEVGAVLNLRAHRYISASGTKGPIIHGSRYLRLFRSKDGKMYLADGGTSLTEGAKYAFPVDMDMMENPNRFWALHRLRPEIVSRSPVSLYPDGGMNSNQEIDEDMQAELDSQDLQVADAYKRLQDEIIPRFIKHLDSALVHRLPLGGDSLCQAMHAEGINLRHLGRIADETTRLYVRQMAIVEMFARSCSRELMTRLRDLAMDSRVTDNPNVQDQDLQVEHCALNHRTKEVVVWVLNHMLANTPEAYKFFQERIAPRVQASYGFCPEWADKMSCQRPWLLNALQIRCRLLLEYSDEMKERVGNPECCDPVQIADIVALMPRVKMARYLPQAMSQLQHKALKEMQRAEWSKAESKFKALVRRYPTVTFDTKEPLSPLRPVVVSPLKSKATKLSKKDAMRRKRRALTQTIAGPKDLAELKLKNGEVSASYCIIVCTCLAHLQREPGCKTEGLFRISGAASKVQSLADSLKKLTNEKLTTIQLESLLEAVLNDYTSHDVACAVKKLIRDLEFSLFTDELFPPVCAAGESGDIEEMTRLVDSLPHNNKKVIQAIVETFNIICSNPETKMSIKACSVVMGPNLLPKSVFFKNIEPVFAILMSHADKIFPTPITAARTVTEVSTLVPENKVPKRESEATDKHHVCLESWLRRLRLLNGLAMCQLEQDKFDDCINTLEEAVECAPLASELELARSYVILMRAYFKVGTPEQGFAMFDLAVNTANGYLGEDGGHPYRVELYSTMGRLYASNDDFEWAEKWFSASIMDAENACGKNHPEVPRQLRHRAEMMSEQAEMKIHEGSTIDALSLAQKASGLFDRALEGYAEIFGADSLSVAEVLYRKAEMNLNVGIPKEAARYASLCYQIRSNQAQGNRMKLLESLDLLGRTAQATENLSTASMYFEQALASHRRNRVMDQYWVRSVTRSAARVYLLGLDCNKNLQTMALDSTYGDANDTKSRAKAIRELNRDSPSKVLSELVERSGIRKEKSKKSTSTMSPRQRSACKRLFVVLRYLGFDHYPTFQAPLKCTEEDEPIPYFTLYKDDNKKTQIYEISTPYKLEKKDGKDSEGKSKSNQFLLPPNSTSVSPPPAKDSGFDGVQDDDGEIESEEENESLSFQEQEVPENLEKVEKKSSDGERGSDFPPLPVPSAPVAEITEVPDVKIDKKLTSKEANIKRARDLKFGPPPCSPAPALPSKEKKKVVLECNSQQGGLERIILSPPTSNESLVLASDADKQLKLNKEEPIPPPSACRHPSNINSTVESVTVNSTKIQAKPEPRPEMARKPALPTSKPPPLPFSKPPPTPTNLPAPASSVAGDKKKKSTQLAAPGLSVVGDKKKKNAQLAAPGFNVGGDKKKRSTQSHPERESGRKSKPSNNSRLNDNKHKESVGKSRSSGGRKHEASKQNSSSSKRSEGSKHSSAPTSKKVSASAVDDRIPASGNKRKQVRSRPYKITISRTKMSITPESKRKEKRERKERKEKEKRHKKEKLGKDKKEKHGKDKKDIASKPDYLKSRRSAEAEKSARARDKPRSSAGSNKRNGTAQASRARPTITLPKSHPANRHPSSSRSTPKKTAGNLYPAKKNASGASSRSKASAHANNSKKPLQMNGAGGRKPFAPSPSHSNRKGGHIGMSKLPPTTPTRPRRRRSQEKANGGGNESKSPENKVSSYVSVTPGTPGTPVTPASPKVPSVAAEDKSKFLERSPAAGSVGTPTTEESFFNKILFGRLRKTKASKSNMRNLGIPSNSSPTFHYAVLFASEKARDSAIKRLKQLNHTWVPIGVEGPALEGMLNQEQLSYLQHAPECSALESLNIENNKENDLMETSATARMIFRKGGISIGSSASWDAPDPR